MKHIKPISELYKSSYKKVADKYKEYHPGRTDSILKHAEDQGKSHPIEREWPYRFDFSNYKKFQPQAGDFRGYFFITGARDHSQYVNPGYKCIIVSMSSNWGINLELKLSWGTGISAYLPKGYKKIDMFLLDGIKWNREIKHDSSTISFLFENRKDIHQFLSYLKKAYLPDLIEDENNGDADVRPNSLTSEELKQFLSTVKISDLWISAENNRYFQPE